MLNFLRRRRRERIRTQSFPAAWTAIIEANVPYWRRLTAEERQRLQGDVLVFLDEKSFEGCGGLELTDEIKVTIAATACLLLLNMEHDFYPRLKSILIYPEQYSAHAIRRGPASTVSETVESRLGESWREGAVVLAWSGVQHGVVSDHAGRNVVLHEFGHQLDQEDGVADGAPKSARQFQRATWARTLGQEYKTLTEQVARGQQTLIDKYGATNPAEFFAVITECFFEKPRELREQHPALYKELMRYYRQDPAERG